MMKGHAYLPNEWKKRLARLPRSGSAGQKVLHGGNAARVAHHILETFFAKEDHRPLPPSPTSDDMHWDFRDADR